MTTMNNSIQASKLCASMKNRTVGIISITTKNKKLYQNTEVLLSEKEAYHVGRTSNNSITDDKEKIKSGDKYKLIHNIKSLGLSYNEFIGYCQEDEQTEPILEESLVIYTDNDKDWLKNRLAKLANKYNQDKFLIIDKENIVYLISCSDINLKKPVINELNLGSFQMAKLPDIYSMMCKNNYVFERMRATSLCSAYLHKVTREKPDEK